MHLKKIYQEHELAEDATCKDFLQIQTEGDREVKRKRKHCNLDQKELMVKQVEHFVLLKEAGA
jgi:hypothetical protein